MKRYIVSLKVEDNPQGDEDYLSKDEIVEKIISTDLEAGLKVELLAITEY